jgi:hypothetical protein
MARVKGEAKDLLEELGISRDIDNKTLEELIQLHPTVRNFVEGHLTFAEALFIETYICNGFNGPRAARTAQFKALNARGDTQLANNILRKPVVKRVLAARIAERAMDADEILARIREVAEGSLEDFIDIKEVNDPGVEGDSMTVAVPDLHKAAEMAKMHLLKEFKYDKDGNITVKLRDQDRALELMAKHLGMFEKHDNRIPAEFMAVMMMTPDERAQALKDYREMKSWEDEAAG